MDAGYYTIGNAVQLLKESHPNISVSKIRFLEDEGLISPMRNRSGYRLYSKNDLERIERILFLQETRYLPLSVIKDELDKDEAAPEIARAQTTLTIPTYSKDITSRLHSIERVPEIVGPSVGFVRELSEAGIISLVHSAHGRILVEGRDFQLIWICAELRRMGIGPKNLRQFAIAANRESSLYEQALLVYVKKAGGVAIQNPAEMHERFIADLDKLLELSALVKNTLIRRKINDPYADSASPDESDEN